MVWYGPTSETVIGVARGETKEPWPPIFLENIVILCFERRFSIQNSVIRLKSNIFPPPNFWTGYDTGNSLDAEKAEKLVKIYRFYRAEEDNQ